MIIAAANQKGGTGKTTTALNLGMELAQLGHNVLLVDLDPQANLTTGLGLNPEQLEYSVYEVLLNYKTSPKFAIQPVTANVDLIPSALALAGAEQELAGKVLRELFLKKALSHVVDKYDFILIDPPPTLGLFTLNALAAADSVLAPVQAQTYALKALPHLEATIDLIRELKPNLALDGILMTMVDRRTNLSVAVEEEAREKYGNKVFTTVIPYATKLAEAPALGMPIRAYAPNSPAAKAYQALAWEIKERFANAV